ncbi:MAG TPA: hypothetical protein VMX94_00345 [Armatimonadota bacterium]|nr:hypothetical protein [Armatimonadota bacterium]
MCILALLAGAVGLPEQSCAGISTVYDFVDHYSEAKVTNAINPGPAKHASGGVLKWSVFLPPSSADEVAATYKVTLPTLQKDERLVLAFSVGLMDALRSDDPEHPFDGVTFVLRVGGQERFRLDLREKQWVDGAVDLTSEAGKRVQVALAADPNENNYYDWALWGEPRIIKLSRNTLDYKCKARTPAGILLAKANTDTSIGIIPTNSIGKKLGDGQPIKLPSDRLVVARFDFTKLRATAVRLLGVDEQISDLAVYAFDPAVEIASFGPSSALVFDGKPVEFRCVVKNVGEGLLDRTAGVQASVRVGQIPDPGAGISDPTCPEASLVSTQTLGPVYPGEERSVSWRVTPVPRGALAASVTVSGAGLGKRSASWWGAVSNSPTSWPSGAEKPECRKLPDGTVVLQNSKLQMTFLKGEPGYTGWVMSTPKGDAWEPVASGAPLGKVVIARGEGSQPLTYQLYPRDLKILSKPNEPPAVSFSATRQIGSSQCRFEWTFKLIASEPRVTASYHMTAEKPVQLLHFSGPMIYAGDGGFGQMKDEALFPGLEWLLSEASSGTENASPPYSLRTVPHPNKVTIPLMAVRSGNILVALEWNPLQKWDGSADRPAALFASPNFLDFQDNHRMGLFVPSVPDWTPENEQIASKPYVLAAGGSICLEADIVVKSECTTVLDAVDDWLARHGVPEPPKLDKSLNGIMELCDAAYLGPTWDEAAKAWKHTNTGPVYFDSAIATYLCYRANNLRDAEKRRKVTEVVGSAIEKAGDDRTLDIALLAGGVERALQRSGEFAAKLMAEQREDGSWPYTPDKTHEALGKSGDSSSGWSAKSAIPILQHTLVTGDPKARAAALKALDYLDKQIRPEGAQTWELQLHVPDILASSMLVRAYLFGYQLTNDKTYLDKAVYWAKSGLPFVYLWNAQDRPIMRYGSIPVYGATWFDIQPWFGVCVQWCGLDYAYSIARLSDFDKSLPWMRIARGILNCGVQQQEYVTKEYPSDIGMYPDAYSPVKGKEEYHWDLNPHLISGLALRVAGTDVFPSTYTVTADDGTRMALTLPAQGAKLQYRNSLLRATTPGTPGASVYAILSGIRSPVSVTVNGEGIELTPDIGKADQGWQFHPDTGVVIIKYHERLRNTIVLDLRGEKESPAPDG